MLLTKVKLSLGQSHVVPKHFLQEVRREEWEDLWAEGRECASTQMRWACLGSCWGPAWLECAGADKQVCLVEGGSNPGKMGMHQPWIQVPFIFGLSSVTYQLTIQLSFFARWRMGAVLILFTLIPLSPVPSTALGNIAIVLKDTEWYLKSPLCTGLQMPPFTSYTMWSKLLLA